MPRSILFIILVVSANAQTNKFSSKLAIYDLKTKTTRTIFMAGDVFEAPNWSPDGKYLLFNRGGKLYRISPDAKDSQPEPVNVDPSLRCNNDHNLSPDGKLIAISASTTASRGSQVYIAQADGSNLKLLAPTVPSYFHGWSPDGKFLSFVGQRNGVFSLFRVSVTGGDEQRLTSKPPYDDGPDYSPDGKWIYFNSNRTGKWEIWRMPSEGAGPDDVKAQQITNDEFENWFPHPSPDGKQLLVFSFPKGTKTHGERLPGVQLRILPTRGAKQPRTLTTFFGGQGTINVNSWSPDSKRFAYVIYAPI